MPNDWADETAIDLLARIARGRVHGGHEQRDIIAAALRAAEARGRADERATMRDPPPDALDAGARAAWASYLWDEVSEDARKEMRLVFKQQWRAAFNAIKRKMATMNDPTDFDPFEPSEADKRVARDLVEQARSGSHPETGHALSRESVAWMIAHAIDTARRDERARIVEAMRTRERAHREAATREVVAGRTWNADLCRGMADQIGGVADRIEREGAK